MPLSSIRTAGVDEVKHGVLVRDPYRWLEDRTLRQTERWIAEQAQRLGSYFTDCDAHYLRKRGQPGRGSVSTRSSW
jgi:hypothetical protein